MVQLVPGDLLEPGFFLRLNQAALAHARQVFLIRNNGFAGDVPAPLAFANPCFVDLAPAFRIRGARVREEEEARTLDLARKVCASGHGPFLLEVLVTGKTDKE